MKEYRDFFELTFFVVLSAVLVYYTPSIVRDVGFLGMLILAWRSKKDYFWFAFFFILQDYPGGLFAGSSSDSIYRLPLYSFAPGVSLSVEQLYLVVMFIKLKQGNKILEKAKLPYFNNDLKLLLFLFIVLIIISPLMGFGFNSMRVTFRILLSLTLFYLIFQVLSDKNDFINFTRLLFPFAFFAIALQVYSLVNKSQLINIFDPYTILIQGEFNYSGVKGAWERPIELAMVLFFTFTASLFFLYYKKHDFRRGYLVAVNTISFISIMMTGTRTWFIAFLLAYFLFFIFSAKELANYIRYSLIAAPFLILIWFFVPTIGEQVENAWSRLITLESFAKGDLTAGGTAVRFDVRAPAVMKAFEESTIFLGTGFSDFHYENADYHVGYPNILLNTGIIGSFFFFYFIVKLLITSLKKHNPDFKVKDLAKISLIPLIILIIMNTGVQVIGFNGGSFSYYMQAFALFFISFADKMMRTENAIKKVM